MKHECIDCNIEIVTETAKRCLSCSNKLNSFNSPRMLGKHHTKESRKKISKATAGEGNPMYGRRLENAPAWRGGKSFIAYPLGWSKTYREQIRYRDGYRCQLCGVPEVECNRKLDVHHIDYDKKNIEEKNLISLCTVCHSGTNHNRLYWYNKLVR